MQNVMELTQIQLDALREVGNIGSGNAATALAQFLDRKIDMSVPNVAMLNFKEITEIVGGVRAEVVGILLRVMGEITGRFLFLIPADTSMKLLMTLIPGYKIDSLLNMGEMEDSCLRETGNILTGAFLNALSVLVQTPMLNSLPSMTFDMAGAMIDSVVANMTAVSDKVLMLETSFIESEEDLKIHIFLFFEPESLSLLLKKIGV